MHTAEKQSHGTFHHIKSLSNFELPADNAEVLPSTSYMIQVDLGDIITGKPTKKDKVMKRGKEVTITVLNRAWYNMFEIRTSTLQNSGVGLFAARKFYRNQVIGIYCGTYKTDQQLEEEAQVREDAKTKRGSRIRTTDEYICGNVDAGGGIHYCRPSYHGGHFINDPRLYQYYKKTSPPDGIVDYPDIQYNMAFKTDYAIIAL